MPRLNLKTIEGRVGPLGGRDRYDREFIFDLLSAYGRSPASVTRLRSGALNIADDPSSEVAQKGVVYFKPTTDDLYAVIDELRTSPTVVRYGTRFVIVTDYIDLLAVDTRTSETLAIPLADIDKQFTFFLPWAGMEKAQYVAEAHADVKAAERMAKLFDQLLASSRGLYVVISRSPSVAPDQPPAPRSRRQSGRLERATHSAHHEQHRRVACTHLQQLSPVSLQGVGPKPTRITIIATIRRGVYSPRFDSNGAPTPSNLLVSGVIRRLEPP